MLENISITVLLWLLLLLIVLSAFFSGSETAMMAVNRYRLRHLAKGNHRSAQVAEKLLQQPDKLLGTILIGNTLANIFASSVATLIALRLWGDVGIALATLVLTLVILIFSEATPKTIAALTANRLSLVVAWPLIVLLYLLYPVVLLVNGVSNAILRLLRIEKPTSTTDHLSLEELRTVVDEAAGRIPVRHKLMLLRIMDLKEMTVDDIMVPRHEIIGIDLEEDWDSILHQLRHAQHTRLPLYADSIENLIGMIHVRDVIHFLGEAHEETDSACKAALKEMAHDIYYLPEGTPLTKQLLNFQVNKRRLGMVVDEYGDLLGLVTLEDILEEIVGEFTTDIASTGEDIEPQADGTYLVDGGINIRELNRQLHWHLPTDGPKTLNGVIVEYLEFMPGPGIGLKMEGYAMEIISMQDQKIKTVKIKPPHLPVTPP